jgi:hypothetical protein
MGCRRAPGWPSEASNRRRKRRCGNRGCLGLASSIPAIRAANLDPIEVLHDE